MRSEYQGKLQLSDSQSNFSPKKPEWFLVRQTQQHKLEMMFFSLKHGHKHDSTTLFIFSAIVRYTSWFL